MKERESKDADADGEEERDEGEGGDGGEGDEVDDGRVLGVFVHHSDYLPIGDQNLLHPNVKVAVMPYACPLTSYLMLKRSTYLLHNRKKCKIIMKPD